MICSQVHGFLFSDDINQEYTKVALQHQPDIQNYSEGNSNGLSVEEIEHQHKENFQRKLLEEERLQRIEANERLKNKRQQRKNLKEKVCYRPCDSNTTGILMKQKLRAAMTDVIEYSAN